MRRSGIIWHGPSKLTGDPVVVVLAESNIPKLGVGRTLAAHILVDEAIPAEAAKDGRDVAICGDCPRRRTPDRGSTCYVSLARAYPAMGRKLVEGRYPVLTVPEIAEAVRGRFLRIGAYGDPAAVPVDFWMHLAGRSSAWTAYTHQWRVAPELRPIMMASVDTRAEQQEAARLGWRTYRVRQPGDTLIATELPCPASREEGYRSRCSSCRGCSGLASATRRDFAIIDHSVQALWDRDMGPRRRRLPVAT